MTLLIRNRHFGKDRVRYENKGNWEATLRLLGPGATGAFPSNNDTRLGTGDR